MVAETKMLHSRSRPIDLTVGSVSKNAHFDSGGTRDAKSNNLI
jgi:hypothetical protein